MAQAITFLFSVRVYQDYPNPDLILAIKSPKRIMQMAQAITFLFSVRVHDDYPNPVIQTKFADYPWVLLFTDILRTNSFFF